MRRGNLIGTFTFRECDHGKDVLVPWSEWVDHLAWDRVTQAKIVEAIVYLESPCTEEERMKAYAVLQSALSRKLTETGFEDRRR